MQFLFEKHTEQLASEHIFKISENDNKFMLLLNQKQVLPNFTFISGTKCD